MSFRARPRLRFISWVRAEVLSERMTRAAQFPERVLQPLLQGHKGLAGNHLGVPPARMAQHQLEQQVAEAPAADGYSQKVAVGEVELRLPARWMLLGEVDLLLRPVECSPVL